MVVLLYFQYGELIVKTCTTEFAQHLGVDRASHNGTQPGRQMRPQRNATSQTEPGTEETSGQARHTPTPRPSIKGRGRATEEAGAGHSIETEAGGRRGRTKSSVLGARVFWDLCLTWKTVKGGNYI